MDIHLHVLLHGLLGTTKHLESAARIFSARHCQTSSESELSAIESQDRAQIQLLLIEANERTKTYDGIDWGAERAVEEIQEAIREISRKGDCITKFSITGYSLGGLFARYVVAVLYAKQFFDTVKPMNFTTFATPHIGAVRTMQDSLLATISRYAGPRMLGNTGKQLYFLDSWGEVGRPLLEVMADKEFIFWKALDTFQNINIYVNAVHDRMVPYTSGAFELLDHFEVQTGKIQLEFEPSYHPLLKSWSTKDDVEVEPGGSSLAERFESWKPLPFMGPFIQWNFPYNLILMALFPMIIPLIIILLPIKFLLNTRSSGIRVKKLESTSMAAREKLAQIFATLHQTVAQVEESLEHPLHSQMTSSLGKQPQIASVLSPAQQKMVADLNQLSVQKHLAWIHPTRNSHAIIICREEKQFAGHALGEGVLRHWADNFTL